MTVGVLWIKISTGSRPIYHVNCQGQTFWQIEENPVSLLFLRRFMDMSTFPYLYRMSMLCPV